MNSNLEIQHQEILTRRELGDRLGVHPNTILRYEKEGTIKGFRLGGRARYIWSDIIEDLKKIPGYLGK